MQNDILDQEILYHDIFKKQLEYAEYKKVFIINNEIHKFSGYFMG